VPLICQVLDSMLSVSSNGEVAGDRYYIVPQSPPRAIRRTSTYPHMQHGLFTEEHPDLDLQSPHIPAVLSKLHSDMPGLPMPRWPSMLGSKQSFVQPRRPIAFSYLPKSLSTTVSKPKHPVCRVPTSDDLRKKMLDFAGEYHAQNERKASQQKIAG
jgi:hypothetical protein